MTPRKDDPASLSGAYALNALGDADRKRFEDHLAESEEARNELTELSDTAVLLGMAVEPLTPPATLKASIMDSLTSTPQVPRLAPVAAPRVERNLGKAEAKAQARWFTRPITVLVASAAAVALVFGGVALANTLGHTVQQQAQADQLAAINAADDSQRQASDVTGGGSATLVWSTGLRSAALIVDGLAELPADKVYELWYIDGSGARGAGTFTVGSAGSTWRVLDGTMRAGDTVGVTVEPAGGTKAPTTDPIVKIASA